MTRRLAIAIASLVPALFAQNAALDHFEKKVRPVLAARCHACHNGRGGTPPQGGLTLDSAAGIRKGGNSGTAIQPGDPDESLLLRAIRYTSKSLRMPPDKPLPPETVADIETWIRNGAPLPADAPVVAKSNRPQLWSLTPPQKSTPPEVRQSNWPRHDIDRFILQKLEAANLTPSPEADRRTLIRRAYFDLAGLPPTVEETDRFAADESPNAYESLIDRLLASPRYGERWGRHWLDVARYADSVNDAVNTGQRHPWSYTYRDWVISALNEDLPYDKFATYQIAADRIPGLDRRHLAALGFLSLGRVFPKSYPETVDDRIDAVTRGFMGFTVACARCHDHKYDPIPTKDYYSLYSILGNIQAPPELPLLAKSDGAPMPSTYKERLDRIRSVDREYRERRNAEMIKFFKTQIAEYLIATRDADGLSNTDIEELIRERQLNAHILTRWRKYLKESKAVNEPVFRLWHAGVAAGPDFAAKWPSTMKTASGNPLVEAEVRAKAPGSLADLAAAYAVVLTRNDSASPLAVPQAEQLRAVLRGPQSPVAVPVEEFPLIYTEGDSNNTRSIRVRYDAMLALAAYDGAPPRAMAIENVPNPAPGHVFVRGNPSNPGAPVQPRFLSCLGGDDEHAFRDGRLELANAIVDRTNPFTARVIVNRIWMHHFGAGLVTTPSDFGLRGDPPSHRELLDHLAVDFVDSGWSLKKLHRRIMLSATYRQSSADAEAGRKADPENRLLWRMNRQRLEIEALRDSMLMASGELNLTMGGPPVLLTTQPAMPRRSVYGFIERGRVPAFLNAFDFASPDQHAPTRYVTTVPQQALFFMNSPFVMEQSRVLAGKVPVTDPSQKVRALYRSILGRDPRANELAAALQFVSEDKLAAAREPSPWRYGTGEYRAESERVDGFTEFAYFAADRWQDGPAIPAARSGKATLQAAGGEPGEKPNQAVVRRWTSPVGGTLSIEGTFRHNQPAVPYGDGVRGRIVSSRHGELASWSVNGSGVETKLNGFAVEKGDTIDFLVDGRRDGENDAFTWTPTLKSGGKTWIAKDEFAGPAPEPLNVWARLAQVLFGTNEFAFVD